MTAPWTFDRSRYVCLYSTPHQLEALSRWKLLFGTPFDFRGLACMTISDEVAFNASEGHVFVIQGSLHNVAYKIYIGRDAPDFDEIISYSEKLTPALIVIGEAPGETEVMPGAPLVQAPHFDGYVEKMRIRGLTIADPSSTISRAQAEAAASGYSEDPLSAGARPKGRFYSGAREKLPLIDLQYVAQGIASDGGALMSKRLEDIAAAFEVVVPDGVMLQVHDAIVVYATMRDLDRHARKDARAALEEAVKQVNNCVETRATGLSSSPVVDIRELDPAELVRETDMVRVAVRDEALSVLDPSYYAGTTLMSVTAENAMTGEQLCEVGKPAGAQPVFRQARTFAKNYRRLDVGERLEAGRDGFQIADPWIWWFALMSARGEPPSTAYDNITATMNKARRFHIRALAKNFLREMLLTKPVDAYGDLSISGLYDSLSKLVDLQTGVPVFPALRFEDVNRWVDAWYANPRAHHGWLQPIQSAAGHLVEPDQEDRYFRIIDDRNRMQGFVMASDPNWMHRLRLWELGKDPHPPWAQADSTIADAAPTEPPHTLTTQVDDMYGSEFEML